MYKANLEVRSVRIINKGKLADKELEKLCNEVKILKCLSHPNIIKFYGAYSDDTKIYIVCESLIGYSELFDHIVKQLNFSEIDAKPLLE